MMAASTSTASSSVIGFHFKSLFFPPAAAHCAAFASFINCRSRQSVSPVGLSNILYISGCSAGTV